MEITTTENMEVDAFNEDDIKLGSVNWNSVMEFEKSATMKSISDQISTFSTSPKNFLLSRNFQLPGTSRTIQNAMTNFESEYVGPLGLFLKQHDDSYLSTVFNNIVEPQLLLSFLVQYIKNTEHLLDQTKRANIYSLNDDNAKLLLNFQLVVLEYTKSTIGSLWTSICGSASFSAYDDALEFILSKIKDTLPWVCNSLTMALEKNNECLNISYITLNSRIKDDTVETFDLNEMIANKLLGWNATQFPTAIWIRIERSRKSCFILRAPTINPKLFNHTKSSKFGYALKMALLLDTNGHFRLLVRYNNGWLVKNLSASFPDNGECISEIEVILRISTQSLVLVYESLHLINQESIHCLQRTASESTFTLSKRELECNFELIKSTVSAKNSTLNNRDEARDVFLSNNRRVVSYIQEAKSIILEYALNKKIRPNESVTLNDEEYLIIIKCLKSKLVAKHGIQCVHTFLRDRKEYKVCVSTEDDYIRIQFNGKQNKCTVLCKTCLRKSITFGEKNYNKIIHPYCVYHTVDGFISAVALFYANSNWKNEGIIKSAMTIAPMSASNKQVLNKLKSYICKPTTRKACSMQYSIDRNSTQILKNDFIRAQSIYGAQQIFGWMRQSIILENSADFLSASLELHQDLPWCKILPEPFNETLENCFSKMGYKIEFKDVTDSCSWLSLTEALKFGVQFCNSNDLCVKKSLNTYAISLLTEKGECATFIGKNSNKDMYVANYHEQFNPETVCDLLDKGIEPTVRIGVLTKIPAILEIAESAMQIAYLLAQTYGFPQLQTKRKVYLLNYKIETISKVLSGTNYIDYINLYLRKEFGKTIQLAKV